MKLLILTPEAELYAETAVAVYAMSGGSLAGWVHARWLGSRPVAFLPLHVGLMAAVTAFAFLALDVPSVTNASWPIVGMSIPVGILAGAIAKWGGSVLKQLAHERARRSRRRARAPWGTGNAPFIYYGQATASLAAARPMVATVMPGPTSRSSHSILALWILAGTLEEVLFRGVLVDIALRLPGWPLIVLFLIAGVAAFAFSHLSLGWSEVLDKLPLGLIALAVALAMRSVAPAVVAHVFFNLGVWQEAATRGGTEVMTGGGIIASRAPR